MRWLAAALLLLAGCLGDAHPEAAGAADAPDDGRTARSSDLLALDGRGRFDAVFRLTINADNVLGGETCVFGNCLDYRDCVVFHRWPDPLDVAFANVTATLAWTPAGPFAEELVLTVRGPETRSAAGPSPLQVSVPALAGGHEVEFAVDTDLPNAPFDQDVELRVAFEFEGDLPAPELGNCNQPIA
jgi:hypothetical protein